METNASQHTEPPRSDPDGWRDDKEIRVELIPSDVITVDNDPQKEAQERVRKMVAPKRSQRNRRQKSDGNNAI
jgi:hypothetical protein